MKINKQQLKIVHALLGKLNMMQYKQELVHEYSNGRTLSSRELSSNEANDLIDHLKKSDPTDRMRKKIISLCYEIGMIYGSSADDKKMNMAVIKAFLLKRGYLKKSLDEYTRSELPKLVYQFQQILKNTEKKQAKQIENDPLIEMEIKGLLFELGF